MKKIFNNTLILFLIITSSCSYPELIFDDLVYENDFEKNELNNINGGVISDYNETKVLGDFNNQSFSLNLNNLKDHNYLVISFDLYIHGTWDGNFNGFDTNDQPDKWIMEVNPYIGSKTDPNYARFETTFSNSPCFSNYCLRQSFPNEYPFENIPKKGNSDTDLVEKCHNSFFGGKSTLYKIEKGFVNNGNAVTIKFSDELYQPNAIDINGVSQQKCDESWSIDNLKVRILKYE